MVLIHFSVPEYNCAHVSAVNVDGEEALCFIFVASVYVRGCVWICGGDSA